jgi:16S rRNA (guanine966-N2)-methyltransferase
MADRMRQSLFAVLEPLLPGAVVLDLCAGSGAAGLEALSRGAAHVTFVERSRDAAATIRENIAALDVGARCTVIVGNATDAVQQAASLGQGGPEQREKRTYSLIIIDPPYDDAAIRRNVLEALGAAGSLLAKSGRVVVTGRRRERDAVGSGLGTLRLVREFPFGETLIELLEQGEEGST